jgi:flagellar hook-associated protein 3
VRVTNKQMLNIVSRSVALSSNQLMKAQERLATRKAINRPSDDPIGTARVLEYRKRLSSIEQYKHNIASSKVRVEMTGSNLEALHELLYTAKGIASQSLGADDSGRAMAAAEITNISEQIQDIANTRLGGSYIFAGHAADTLPFPQDEVTTGDESSLSGGEYFKFSSSTTDYYVWYDIDDGSTDPGIGGRTGIEVDISSGDTAEDVAAATESAINAAGDADLTAAATGASVVIQNDEEGVDVVDGNTGFRFNNATYNGDSGKLRTILGEGVTLITNCHGDEVFTGVGVDDGANIFEALNNLQKEFDSPVADPTAIQNQIDELAKGISQVEKAIARQATALNRLDQTEEYWDHLKLKFENLLSDTEDIDTAQVAMELKVQETTYEMALSAAANMLERNLMDFLA